MKNGRPQTTKIFNSPKGRKELVAIFSITVFIFILSSSYDFFEHLVEVVHTYEPWNLDEVFTISLFLVIALAVFAVRRWREAVLSETQLRLQNERLRDAISEIHRLRGILPICAACKKIRDDNGYWHQVEVYIRDHSEADFSHSICPDCMKKLYPEYQPGEDGVEGIPADQPQSPIS